MTGLIIYLIGYVIAYIIIRIIGGQAHAWKEVNDRLFISAFSWLTVLMFTYLFIKDLIDDAIWEYRCKHPRKPKKPRKPINPPKFL